MHEHLAAARLKTGEEKLVLELGGLFGETDSMTLFVNVFLWYFSPHKSVRMGILNDAEVAHRSYIQCGSVPTFFRTVPLLYSKIRSLIDAPTGGRHNPEREESDMKQALLHAYSKTSLHECAPYDRRDCPCFWDAVFLAYYGEKPESAKDSRYDTLFAVGMPAYRKLFP